MCLHLIHRLETFEALRSRWDSVHADDPHASVFNSWGWLRGWLGATSSRWVVLAVSFRDETPPDAFLPLAIQREQDRFPPGPITRVVPAGHPVADHAGLVCSPDRQEAAISVLARGLSHLMRDVDATEFALREGADPRWSDLLQHFQSHRFAIRWEEGTPCPFIPLPATWDEYIGGSKKRKSLLRKAEEDGFLITHTDGETLERDIDIFLDLHQLRLGEKPPAYLAMMRSLVRWAHRTDRLHMVVLWSDEDEPAAVNVAFTDPGKGVFHAYNGGWDEWYQKHSPRRIAELYSIRYAIEHGYHTYDFGRGDEAYKYGFGARESHNTNAVLIRRTPMGSARRMARRIPEALATERHAQASLRPRNSTATFVPA